MTLRSALISALTLAIVACAGSAPPPASTGSPSDGKESTAEQPTGTADPRAPAGEGGYEFEGQADSGAEAAPAEEAGEGKSPAPAPPPAKVEIRGDSSAGDRDEASKSRPAPTPEKKAPELRPGLATLWGEDRDSSIHFTTFLRDTPTRPLAVARVFYNDRDGVEAMAAASRRGDFADGGRREGQGFVTLRLLDENGAPLPTFEVASRQYVIGEAGGRYSLTIENHTDARLEAVATVDGLDVIDGKPGSFEKRGYLVDPFGRMTIEGFRRSMNKVAAFRFGSVRDSYAAQKGNARNVGLVGIAFFHERGSRPRAMSDEVRRRHDADAFPGRFADPPSGR